MPHKNSEANPAPRRQRASQLGYLRLKPSDGHGLVEVPQQIKDRIAASIELHRKHWSLAGLPIHFVASAALAVKNFIGSVEFMKTKCVHRHANHAKHNWQRKAFEPDPRAHWQPTSAEQTTGVFGGVSP